MAKLAGIDRGAWPSNRWRSGGAGERRPTAAAVGRAWTIAFGLALALSASAARADGPMPRYHGLHPVSPHQGAFCYIDVPHVHRVPPPDLRVYLVMKNGEYLFIGDPAALGYDGPKVGYFGPHPLAVPDAPDEPPLFCYIAGPHYHVSAQPPSPTLVEKAGVTWYLGALPPPGDPGRVWINEVHGVASYTPPRVDLSMAPPGYHPFQVLPPAPAPAPAAAPPVASKGKARAPAPARAAKSAGGARP
jgi:hypothetical protein